MQQYGGTLWSWHHTTADIFFTVELYIAFEHDKCYFFNQLTHCALVAPYDDLGQCWLR